ncbi:GGDEF domain-containing protein [Rhodanobacter sp. AS-Z3]|uniref:GGDEF domain-containing protein n=1 Tax=Rhodanobacter sp. AS-Z3 TaxID=3031330 RepID=UPI0024792F81|nr:GGDEF domain-containing protein [Rhodanobacter sp. AS-Z3]WEN15078.1 GGDEF domain-containing protein [Rhodanobacter sp. AS-Z3]
MRLKLAWRRRLSCLGLVAALFLCGGPLRAAMPPSVDVAALLTQAQSLRTTDHARFLQLLQQLHQHPERLSTDQQWRLRLLDAWQASFEGDYPKAEPLLRDVAAHARDLDQRSLANGMLLNMLAIQDKYEEAFTLAEQLATTLPNLRDQHTTYVVLSQLSQLMASAGQKEPAVGYAKQMELFGPPGGSLCRPYVYLFGALNAGDDLKPGDPIFRKAIDTCIAAKEPLYAETVQLDLARRQVDAGNSSDALALLKRIAPSVLAQDFKVHVYVLRSTLGYAYWADGNAQQARRWALAALAMDPDGDFEGQSEYTYRVLYELEKQAGNYRAALDYYRHYKNVKLRSVTDTQAIALAYHTVHQQLAIRKLQLDELSKQNRLLELQQALDRKAMETSRLYFALLLLVLASIVYLLVRIKRSQLRFQKLARRDSLTGIFNHQHFVSEAARVLRYAEKSSRNACVVLIDLDHFKRVNDTYGHAAGDAVLIRVAGLCQSHLRSIDVFGRLGGEEFGVVLADCSLQVGWEIVERMREALASLAFDGEVSTEVISASFGLASTEASGYALATLMANADAALYRAKDRGRNCVETYVEFDRPRTAAGKPVVDA